MNSLCSLKRARRCHTDEDEDDEGDGDDNDDGHINAQYEMLKRCASGKESGATTIDDLSDALLEQILIRLPHPISANKCKCVSKRWLSLISTHCFARSFVRRPITFMASKEDTAAAAAASPLQFPIKFIHEYPNMFTQFSLSFLPCYWSDGSSRPRFPVRVLASSNDLLLCRSPFSPRVYYICNPFTKQWVEIPFLTHVNASYYSVIGFMCDSFYKIVDNETTGYRLIETPYRYKILRVVRVKPFREFSSSVEVFSSETGQWSKLAVSCPQFLQVVNTQNCSSSFVIDGKLHWMCGTRYIFAYDPFNNDSVEIIDRPVELRGAENVHLGVYRGSLRLLKFSVRSSCCRVWQLEDYSRGIWFKVHEFSMWSPSEKIAIAFDPYDENIVYIWFVTHGISCNMRSRKYNEITGSLHDNGDKVFLLLRSWFPTPVSSSLLHH